MDADPWTFLWLRGGLEKNFIFFILLAQPLVEAHTPCAQGRGKDAVTDDKALSLCGHPDTPPWLVLHCPEIS